MTREIRPLHPYLAEIEDPRKLKGLRHSLVAILSLCVVALMCGAKNPRLVAVWWKNRKDLGPLLERLGFTKGYGASKSTLYRVLSKTVVKQLETKINKWIEANLADLPLPDGEELLEGVAIDGKELRGSRQQGASNTHLLGAISHRLGLVLAQLAVEDKTNEIGAMPEFLVGLILKGRVFTTDALLTQRKVAQTIVDNGGDYVFIVKDNHPTLREDLETLFAEPGAEPFIHDQVTTVNAGHGRIERRTLRTSLEMNDFLDWPGLQQVFRLDRKTTIKKTGVVREETVHGISSLSPDRADAVCLLTLTRQHWVIENRLHWVRDVTFGEDASQARMGNLPQVMAALRNCAINLLRLHNFSLIPDGFDYFAAYPFEALAAIGC